MSLTQLIARFTGCKNVLSTHLSIWQFYVQRLAWIRHNFKDILVGTLVLFVSCFVLLYCLVCVVFVYIRCCPTFVHVPVSVDCSIWKKSVSHYSLLIRANCLMLFLDRRTVVGRWPYVHGYLWLIYNQCTWWCEIILQRAAIVYQSTGIIN